jgi:hypothetical protein
MHFFAGIAVRAIHGHYVLVEIIHKIEKLWQVHGGKRAILAHQIQNLILDQKINTLMQITKREL